MTESPFSGDACVLTSRCGWPVAVVWDDLSASALPVAPRQTDPVPDVAALAVAGLPLDEAEQRAVEWGGMGHRCAAGDVEAVSARLRASWRERE